MHYADIRYAYVYGIRANRKPSRMHPTRPFPIHTHTHTHTHTCYVYDTSDTSDGAIYVYLVHA
jgi:hypothetical protein